MVFNSREMHNLCRFTPFTHVASVLVYPTTSITATEVLRGHRYTSALSGRAAPPFRILLVLLSRGLRWRSKAKTTGAGAFARLFIRGFHPSRQLRHVPIGSSYRFYGEPSGFGLRASGTISLNRKRNLVEIFFSIRNRQKQSYDGISCTNPKIFFDRATGPETPGLAP